ncbi:hypothetical protein [Blastococcus brunescens]|uniref:DUF5666 domain-containing protein n=1 Tax=Blastococcus brunescens TaxID=1564165 RepID=A0ABZ1B6C8_9ACTN|nr:hypothetical protein [Blastococcus sp. BMG 8361]WRL66354.1 hypothetical protein U6N30_13495 [Blastococcus sp. BMG 8361]
MSSTITGTNPAGRVAGAAVAAALALTGCGGGSVEPAPSAVSAEDLEQVRDEVAALEDRVASLEDRLDDGDPADPPDEAGSPGTADTFFGDPEAAIGREVVVRGEVTELLAATDVASAFRITGDVGEPVAVVSVTPPPAVATGDVVEVSGSAVEVDPDSFEADFGIAADELFDDPEAWLTEADGQVAIAAVRIEVTQATAGG